MDEIRVIDHGHMHAHLELEYTTPDAKRSWFQGVYPVVGGLKAKMCSSCGRVAFYGVPKSAS
jgi:hypothetical protein